MMGTMSRGDIEWMLEQREFERRRIKLYEREVIAKEKEAEALTKIAEALEVIITEKSKSD